MLAMLGGGHLKCECPTLKEKGLFWGECLNSPSGLERHSPPVQPTVEIEGGRVIGRTDKFIERDGSLSVW